MRTTLAHNDARRGVVLIVVVGVLALLMILASTLALVSRLGYRMSVVYTNTESLDLEFAAIEAYCKNMLSIDRFGRDGFPYNNDPAGANAERDESYDWAGEPWLNYDGYSAAEDTAIMLGTGDYGLAVDENGDGTPDVMARWNTLIGPEFGIGADTDIYGDIGGNGLRCRFALHFTDFGGCIDLNNAGFWPGDSPVNGTTREWEYVDGDPSKVPQSQGLTPAELNVPAVNVSVSANAMTRAFRNSNYIHYGGRWRDAFELDDYDYESIPSSPHYVYPGDGSAADSRLPEEVDRDADGIVDDYSARNDPSLFRAIYSAPEDTPFGAYDLDDLFMRRDNGSRLVSMLLLPQAQGGPGLTAADLRFFAINIPTSPIAPPPPAGAARTSRVWTVGGAKQYGTLDLARLIHEVPASELAEFIWALGPTVTALWDHDDNPITPAVPDTTGDVHTTRNRRVINQVAVNIRDAIDEDTKVTTFVDSDGCKHFGVETVPYLYDAEFALPMDTTLEYFIPTDTPAMGKYIKLVNPWNRDIPLYGAYRLRLPMRYDTTGTGEQNRLRRWVLAADTANYTYISVPYTDTDIVIDFDDDAGNGGGGFGDDMIRARGHFLLVDREETLKRMLGLLPTDPLPGGEFRRYYRVDTRLQYAQECAGWPLPTVAWTPSDEYRIVRYEVPAGSEFEVGDIFVLGPSHGAGFGLTHGQILVNDKTNRVLVFSLNDPTKNVTAGMELFRLPPDTEQHVYVATSDAQPPFDWFEDPPAAGDVPPWINTWAAGAGADGAAVQAMINAGADGAPTVIEIEQYDAEADTWVQIQYSAVPDTATGTAEDEDDFYLLRSDTPLSQYTHGPCINTQLSAQMTDPRPCWYRFDNTTLRLTAPASDAEAAAAGPWGEGTWERLEKGPVTPPLTQDPTDASWFNRNWLTTSNAQVSCGDYWHLVDGMNADNILHSFPPWDSSHLNDVEMDYYTGVNGHETAIMNAGRMPTRGSLGFVHAGIPWTTLSFGDYGQWHAVHLTNFMNYLAVPCAPYEVRPGMRYFHIRQRFDVDGPAGTAQPVRCAAADFNNDGFKDLAVTGGSDGYVHVLFGRKGGGFSRRTSIDLGGDTYGIVAADLDGAGNVADGNMDLAVTRDADDDVVFLRGDGTGAFSTTPAAVSVAGGPSDIVAADFNGDGRLDLAVTRRGADMVTVLTRTGANYTPTEFATASSPVGIVAGDFNRDGRLDLAVAGNGASVVRLHYKQPGGAFGAVVGQYQDSATGAAPEVLAAGDFNGDDRLDVAAALPATGQIGVLYGQATGGLGSYSGYASGSGTHGISAADFNGDGYTDVVTANQTGGSGGTGSVRVIRGGDSGMLVDTPIDTGEGLYAIAAGDFDGNGTPEFVAVGRTAGTTGTAVSLANLGGTPRVFGRINVNTAPAGVLRALFKRELDNVGGSGISAAGMASAIVIERATNGPFTSVDNFFWRMRRNVELFPAPGGVFSFRAEAQARFMANLITVRTDLWGVRARAQVFRDLNGDGERDAGEEIVVDRSFYMVLDRSQQPVRTVLKRYAQPQ